MQNLKPASGSFPGAKFGEELVHNVRSLDQHIDSMMFFVMWTVNIYVNICIYSMYTIYMQYIYTTYEFNLLWGPNHDGW